MVSSVLGHFGPWSFRSFLRTKMTKNRSDQGPNWTDPNCFCRPISIFQVLAVSHLLYSWFLRTSIEFWTLWRPLLPYGYNYQTSCARPG